MPQGKYTVNEVEERTKVPASTLRQWERRYGFPKPERSEAGYRLYSDLDLSHIGAMKRHIASGIPASRAAELVRRNVPTRPASRSTAELRSELADALAEFDETKAGELLSEAYALHPAEEVMTGVMAGALEMLAKRRREGGIGAGVERYATSYLQGRLSALLGLYPSPRGAPTVLVACTPGERRELAPLILTVVLRRHGFRALYLADTPLPDLAGVSASLAPLAIVISATRQESVADLTADGASLLGSAPILGFSGDAFSRDPGLVAEVGGTFLGSDARETAERFGAAVRALEAHS